MMQIDVVGERGDFVDDLPKEVHVHVPLLRVRQIAVRAHGTAEAAEAAGFDPEPRGKAARRNVLTPVVDIRPDQAAQFTQALHRRHGGKRAAWNRHSQLVPRAYRPIVPNVKARSRGLFAGSGGGLARRACPRRAIPL